MEDFNFKELFHYIISKIYIVFGLLTLIVAGGIFYSNNIKVPMYQSNTKLVLISEANATQITTSDVTLSNNLVKTYSEIIKSQDILKKVKDNLNLEMSTEQLAGKIGVSSTTNTQLINVTVTDKDAAEAQRIAIELANVFKEEIAQLYKIDNVQIVEKASLADSPYNVNQTKELLLYIASGLITGISVVTLKFYFDNTIKNSASVEDRVGLTVLGVIPAINRKEK